MKLGQVIVFALIAGVLMSGPKPVAAATITDAQLTDYINRMSLEEQIGQLFVAPTPASPTDAQTAVAKYHLGGLILFGRDLTGKTAAQVATVVRADQAKAKVPLLIATDQEGGSVSRLSSSLTYANTPFPSPQAANRVGGMAKVLAAATTAQKDLAALGVNWNFAPVADVSTNPASFIYARTFGQNYQATADYIKQVVPVMQSTGVGATLKHFPGYGDQGDTHVALPPRHGR
nr:glycoside hydrolase family 3 N-terminal domain-containing protein [Lacticaseibacillus nasuensis]